MEKIDRSALLVLHHYNHYANNLVLDVVSKMTSDELAREVSPSHGSVKELLLHMALCEYGFMLRCSGIPLDIINEDFDSLDLAGICALFDRIASMRKKYLDNSSEEELAEVVTIEMRGTPLRLPRWQLLAQSLIHSTHHRGELSIVMTELGYPLPTLDPILMYIHDSGQEWPSD